MVIKNLKTDKEAFLDGHSHEVSCIAVSKDGKKVASGQINIAGVKVGKLMQIVVSVIFDLKNNLKIRTGRCHCLGSYGSEKAM